nr:GspH/FimT family pseudopilin [uncultured Cupriavidus sp.]
MGQSFCREAVGLLAPVLPVPEVTSGKAAHAPEAARAYAAESRRTCLHSPAISSTSVLSAPQHQRRATRGLTLIELLVALTVLSILAAAAIPNFKSFLHNSRLSSDATRLFTDLELARSEAARRNATVTICPLDTGNLCSDDWSLPRILFVDADNDGIYSNTEELIRHSDTPQPTTAITGLNLGVTLNRVRVRSTGSTTAPTASWKFCERNSTEAGQTVLLTGSGRPSIQLQSICP